MTTRKEDDLSREAGHEKTAREYEEVLAEAKEAAKRAAAACQNLHEGLPAYMNAYYAVLRKHGLD